jgi:hypothetical protein
VTANGATAPTPSARGVTPQGAPASAGSRAATGAAAGADPANSPSASGAADATDKQAGAATPGDKRRLHGGHIDTNGHTRSGNPPPRDQPVLEENPYLHR